MAMTSNKAPLRTMPGVNPASLTPADSPSLADEAPAEFAEAALSALESIADSLHALAVAALAQATMAAHGMPAEVQEKSAALALVRAEVAARDAAASQESDA